MEIDFMGLNSPKLKQENPSNPHIDAGGGFEISLSLSTTTSSLNFSQRKKWESAACQNMISSSCTATTVCSSPSYSLQEKTEKLLVVAPPLFRPAAGGFLYDLNDAAATVNLRNMSQRTCPNVFTEQNKVDENKVYMCGNATTRDYSPTVAMARRATLARFLEKRLHRLNQARACHMNYNGKMNQLSLSHSCETTYKP